MGRRGRPGMGLNAGPAMRGGRRQAGQRLGPGARQQLQEAHQLKQSGRFAEAAAKFDTMGGIARERGMSRMSAWLFAQAAQCHAKAGDRRALVSSTENAISDARLEGDARHSARTFGELVGSLDGTPFAGAKGDIEGAIRNALGVAPSVGGEPVAVNRSQSRGLPTECDGCGAPVSASLVKFTEDGHADCPYCGSVLTA
jgi:hypothetical protein